MRMRDTISHILLTISYLLDASILDILTDMGGGDSWEGRLTMIIKCPQNGKMYMFFFLLWPM